ncbi:MAG: hypothetical protein HYV63_17875 [Candidatus Schekmanbacteria bacterium]|nr:hypothetical protein [Candidatus Schekmanbacteria bacterium]
MTAPIHSTIRNWHLRAIDDPRHPRDRAPQSGGISPVGSPSHAADGYEDFRTAGARGATGSDVFSEDDLRTRAAGASATAGWHVAAEGVAGRLSAWAQQAGVDLARVAAGDESEASRLSQAVAQGVAREALPGAVKDWLYDGVDLGGVVGGDEREQARLVQHVLTSALQRRMPAAARGWLPQDMDFRKLIDGDREEWRRVGHDLANKVASQMATEALGTGLPANIDWVALAQGDQAQTESLASHLANRALAETAFGESGYRLGYSDGRVSVGKRGGSSTGTQMAPYGSSGETLWERTDWHDFAETRKRGHDETLGDYVLAGKSRYGAATRTYRDSGGGRLTYGVEGFAGVEGEYNFAARKHAGEIDGRDVILETQGGIHGQAGITGRAEVSAAAGQDGVGLHAGAEVFAGAEVGIHGRTDVTVGDYHIGAVQGSAAGRAGIGAGARADVGYHNGKLSFDYGAGVTYGLGFDYSYGVEIDTREIKRMAEEEGWDDASLAVLQAGHMALVEAPAEQLTDGLRRGTEKINDKLSSSLRKLF